MLHADMASCTDFLICRTTVTLFVSFWCEFFASY